MEPEPLGQVMNLYLYLNEHWHAHTWVKGGRIPIKPASTYKSLERKGIFTPDENLIHDSSVDLLSLKPLLRFENVRKLTMTNNRKDGALMPDVHNASIYEEDGLILSFCHKLSDDIARRMKKKSCVKIKDINALKRCIDRAVGVRATAKNCRYTEDHQRNHFLKSKDDSWQSEFRMFWNLRSEVRVTIPPGLAEYVCDWGSVVVADT